MNSAFLLPAAFLLFAAADPSAEVRHEDAVVLTYTARVDGPYLVVRAAVAPGWHTFALDNVKRVQEKLAGKPALSMDRSTEIAVTGAQVDGAWRQLPPRDFSRPELRMFSFGYDHDGMFAVKLRPGGESSAKLRIRGQACTDSICKNIDVALMVPVPSKLSATHSVNVDELVQAR